MKVITLLPDPLDERSLLDREPVGQLDQHLGPPFSGECMPAGDPVDRLGGLDQRAGLLLGGLPGIGERGSIPLYLSRLLIVASVGHREEHDVAALLRGPDLPGRDPRRRLVERLE
jgi:hypothetical protein